VINFYAQGEVDGISFEVYFSAESHKMAKEFAESVGWTLVGQEEAFPEEEYAMFELALFKPDLH